MNMNGSRRNSVFAPEDPVKVHPVVFVSWTWSTAMGIRMIPIIMVMIRPIQSPALLSALVSDTNLRMLNRKTLVIHALKFVHSFFKFVFLTFLLVYANKKHICYATLHKDYVAEGMENMETPRLLQFHPDFHRQILSNASILGRNGVLCLPDVLFPHSDTWIPNDLSDEPFSRAL